MHSVLLLDAAAFHLAERWFQKECPNASPAAAERWAARHRARFRTMAVEVLDTLAALREKKGQAVRGLPPSGQSR